MSLDANPVLTIRVSHGDNQDAKDPQTALKLAEISHDIYGNTIDIARSLQQNYDINDVLPAFNDQEKTISLTGTSESGKELFNRYKEVEEGKSPDRKLVESFRGIQKRIKENGFSYDVNFTFNGKSYAVTNDFKKSKNFQTKRRKTFQQPALQLVSGEMLGSGGENPNIHLRTTEETIIIECTKEQAKSLEGKLYDKINLSIIDISLLPQEPTKAVQTETLKARPILVNHYAQPHDVAFIENTIIELHKAASPTKYLMSTTIDLIAEADNHKLTLLVDLVSNKRLEKLWQKAIVVPLLPYCLYGNSTESLNAAMARILEAAYPGSPHIEKLKLSSNA